MAKVGPCLHHQAAARSFKNKPAPFKARNSALFFQCTVTPLKSTATAVMEVHKEEAFSIEQYMASKAAAVNKV
jgi:hypothetical protein